MRPTHRAQPFRVGRDVWDGERWVESAHTAITAIERFG
jgi:hypothetical protein